MSKAIEELIKNINEPIKPKKPKKVKKKTNKGKKLRDGKFVYKRPYKMPESIKIKIDQVWYSEKTGKTYSSKSQKLANESRSQKMKEYWKEKKQTTDWKIRNIKKKIDSGTHETITGKIEKGITWDDLNTDNWDSNTEGTFLREIFYNTEGDEWDIVDYDKVKEMIEKLLDKAAKQRKHFEEQKGIYEESKDKDWDYLFLSYKNEANGQATLGKFFEEVFGLSAGDIKWWK